MKKHHPANERAKRKYLAYLKEAMRYSEATIDGVAKALSRFEDYTGYQEFKYFTSDKAVKFKRYLTEQNGQRSGTRLSKATLHSTLTHLKRFFHWLAGQPGYRSRLQYSDAEYFNLSEKDTRIATAKREQRFPTLAQVKHVIKSMPTTNDIERRNRALVAFTLLTGARDSAIASMKLKHIDLVTGCVHQDAREVKTKFSKTFSTFFFPVGDEVAEIVVDWVHYLSEDKLWGGEDPIFPATKVVVGKNHQFEADGLAKVHWQNATPIRKIFRDAFTAANLPYFNPHSIRSTLVHFGEERCKTPEEFKAWSQNLGHEKVLTTFLSYGAVSYHRQSEIMRGLAAPRPTTSHDAEKFADVVLKRMQEAGVAIGTADAKTNRG